MRGSRWTFYRGLGTMLVVGRSERTQDGVFHPTIQDTGSCPRTMGLYSRGLSQIGRFTSRWRAPDEAKCCCVVDRQGRCRSSDSLTAASSAISNIPLSLQRRRRSDIEQRRRARQWSKDNIIRPGTDPKVADPAKGKKSLDPPPHNPFPFFLSFSAFLLFSPNLSL